MYILDDDTDGLLITKQQATERFWNEHDPQRTLNNVYQDVRWISIPEFVDPNFFVQMHKLRVSKVLPATCSISAHHISVLIQIELANMLNAQRERRVVKLTNELWKALQNYVVDNFSSNHFSVGAFLAQHFKSGSPMADHVYPFQVSLFFKKNVRVVLCCVTTAFKSTYGVP